jgi:hypothetical protein
MALVLSGCFLEVGGGGEYVDGPAGQRGAGVSLHAGVGFQYDEAPHERRIHGGLVEDMGEGTVMVDGEEVSNSLAGVGLGWDETVARSDRLLARLGVRGAIGLGHAKGGSVFGGGGLAFCGGCPEVLVGAAFTDVEDRGVSFRSYGAQVRGTVGFSGATLLKIFDFFGH